MTASAARNTTSAAAAPALSPALVGVAAGPSVHDVDARWLMAYAAGIGETDPRYFDTCGPAGPIAHPLFAVCYEWPLAVELRRRAIGEPVAALGVHLTHEVALHRPPRAGDRLTTMARIAGVDAHRAGTLVTTRFETADADGAPVTTTTSGSLYRGVSRADGLPGDRAGDDRPGGAGNTHTAQPPDAAVRPESGRGSAAAPVVAWDERVTIAANAAHVYTECSRIWNPIHTDIAVARAARLPALILHGTATLALALCRVMARTGAAPDTVTRVGARFTGMVPMPSTLLVRGLGDDGRRALFDVVDLGGRHVLTGGFLER